jgi:DNA-binding MarR family transcriptional regulator
MAAGGEAGPTIGELAGRLQLRHHSVVELADRLAERGLIARCRVPGDRRHVHIRLTPEGETTLGKLSLHHKAELQTAGPALVRALAAVISRGEQDRNEGMAEQIEAKP